MAKAATMRPPMMKSTGVPRPLPMAIIMGITPITTTSGALNAITLKKSPRVPRLPFSLGSLSSSGSLRVRTLVPLSVKTLPSW